ncbi:MAG: CotH kinase family protein [Planctomycetota bacterium]
MDSWARKYLARTLFVVSALAFLTADVHADVRINELLAANRFVNLDESGDRSDWIELLNTGDEAVSLEGYTITDDREDPKKWVFPDVTIAPGEHLIVWASGEDRISPEDETIEGNSPSLIFEPEFVREESIWRYLVADPDEQGPPAGWNEPNFDDRDWAQGQAGFGYDDDDDNTELEEDTGAVFVRRRFQIRDRSRVRNLILQIDYDDGFIAFLNGTRVASRNASPEEPNFESVANGKHEAGNKERFVLSEQLDLLIEGTNVLALVGLNDIPSSDMSLDAELGTVPPVLHTNFELDRGGESLLFLDPGGQIVDAVVFPEQAEDRSYGRPTDDLSEWKFYLTPTPGERNTGLVFDEPISAEVTADPPPARYRSDVDVTLSTDLPVENEIRYTTDGSVPDSGSTRFRNPIRVTRNTVIRAAAFIANERATHVITSSYFVSDTISLPILSIALEPDEYEAIHNNSSGRGRAWERAAHFEFFEPDRGLAVSTGIGMRLHGGAGRGGDFDTKKAYKVYFRQAYGDGKLRYPIIPLTDVEVFDKLVLRSGFNDSFRTNDRAAYVRDELIRRLHGQMGAPFSHGSWCALYVNMRLRGLYNIVERMDHDFLSSYFEGEDWDVVKTGNDPLDGDLTEWNRLHDFAENNDMADDANFEELSRMIDVENFTSYMLVNLWAQNHDWPHNNWYAARERVPEGKWIFLCWDSEFGMGLMSESRDRVRGRVRGGVRE